MSSVEKTIFSEETSRKDADGRSKKGIEQYLDNERFLNCRRAFLVTGNQKHDELNRQLLAKNQSGHWFFSTTRPIEQGDAIFLLLPSTRDPRGYPRELYCGVLNAPPDRTSVRGKVLFNVECFHPLDSIPAEIKRYLGDKVPPQGDKVLDIWNREVLHDAPEMRDEYQDDDASYPEGAEKFKQHRYKERSGKAVKQAKEDRWVRDGKLACEVCDFDFAHFYGDRGNNFIEAHHKIPVSSYNGLTTVRKEDFALVCSNCHRMLHRMAPLMTVERLKQQLPKTAKKK